MHMKETFYCEHCNGLTDEQVCPKCGRVTEKPQNGDMCYVNEFGGMAANMFADALSGCGIQFIQVPVFSGYNMLNTPDGYKFYVKYEQYAQASEIIDDIWGGHEQQDDSASVIDRLVTVIIDRPLGSVHPNHADIKYTVNYGFVEGVTGGDGEEQDAYVLGVPFPVKKFDGYVVAVIVRKNDVETKWVVAPIGTRFTREEIEKAVNFQEKFFDIEIIM